MTFSEQDGTQYLLQKRTISCIESFKLENASLAHIGHSHTGSLGQPHNSHLPGTTDFLLVSMEGREKVLGERTLWGEASKSWCTP